jgi:glyoxylase-like metal-dependent hydrolase (beta-lactamase superfamily II)
VFGDEIAPGLRRWTAPHPDWRPGKGGLGGWEREVACLWVDAPDAVVLVDPLAPPEGSAAAEAFWAAVDEAAAGPRPLLALLTLSWHVRSLPELRRRLDVPVLGLAEVRDASSHAVTRVVAPGERLPGGILVHAAAPISDGRVESLLYLEVQRAAVSGDLLIGTPDGLRVWWEFEVFGLDVYRARSEPALRALAERPLDLVLPGHGPPVLSDGRASLERALAAEFWGH